MVRVEVQIAEGVNELLWLEVANFGDHHGQEGVGRDVERYPEKNVGAALVQLATQFTVRDVELKKSMAGRQGHEVQFTGVPGAYDVSSAGWFFFDRSNDFFNLIKGITIGFAPIGPLGAVDAAEVTILVGPVIPNGHLVVLQVFYVGVSLDEPKQFVDDGAQVKFLGGEQGELVLERVTHLGPEYRIGAGAGAIVPVGSLGEEAFK